jgi:L-amino acid N-acyltransferase YncA
MAKKPTQATSEKCTKSENVKVIYIGTPWNNLLASLEDVQAHAARGEVAAIAVVALLSERPGAPVSGVLSGYSCRDTSDRSAGQHFYELVGGFEQLKLELLLAARAAEAE